MNSVELSVVIPGYNEQAVIENTLQNVYTFLENLSISFELIFINDGSSDSTDTVVRSMTQKLPNLKLISYTPNMGRGYAIRQGINASRGKYILTMESDMLYGLPIIRDLYYRIKEGGEDAIVASPYMKGGRTRNIPRNRAILSKWGNKILALAVGNSLHTLSGMTRIYDSRAIKEIALYSNDKEIHLEILSKLISLGYRVSEIPATLAWPKKKEQKTIKRSAKFSAYKYIKSHLLFTFMERPLFFFGFFGLLALAAGIILGLYIVYLRYSGTLNPIRPLMTLLVLLVLGGVVSIAFGLIGLQISDIRKDIYRLQGEIRNQGRRNFN